MIELDIDSLDEVTLLRLNRRIVERLAAPGRRGRQPGGRVAARGDPQG